MTVDEKTLEFYKSAIDMKEMFDDNEYYHHLYEKLDEFCRYKNISIENLIKDIQAIFFTQKDRYESLKINDPLNVIAGKIAELLLWPIFNDKEFMNKTFKDYNIDMEQLKEYIFSEFVERVNDNITKKLVNYQFIDNKLVYLIFELDGGIKHVHKNNKLEKIIFADGSEIIVPE